MILLISVSVFLTLSAIVLLVYQLATAQQRQVAARLEQMARGEQTVVAKTSAYQEEEPTGIRRLLRSFGRYLESPRWDLSLEMRMLRAGLPLRSGEFIVLCFASATLLAMLFLLLGGGQLVAGVTGAVAGFFFPFILVNMKIARRMKAFNGQLGDALILIANSLRTGYSFMQASDMVA